MIEEQNILTATSENSVEVKQTPIYIAKKPIYDFFKRIFDVVCSAIGLIVLFVPFGILSLIIIIDSPGASPIYWHERVGKNGKKFKLYKFRSMVPNAEDMLGELLDKNEMTGPVFKIKDDPRITRVGRFIRKKYLMKLLTSTAMPSLVYPQMMPIMTR